MDASIARYSDFESDRFAVGRIRRRAFGVKITDFLKIHKNHENYAIHENACEIVQKTYAFGEIPKISAPSEEKKGQVKKSK